MKTLSIKELHSVDLGLIIKEVAEESNTSLTRDMITKIKEQIVSTLPVIKSSSNKIKLYCNLNSNGTSFSFLVVDSKGNLVMEFCGKEKSSNYYQLKRKQSANKANKKTATKNTTAKK